ncbi:MFS transporter [Methylobacterium frigidaeris]|uniref:MFS transporter n=1 Tax=Methylobacterium frigidaeris TaxID=2038277 RepID=UPI001EE0B7D5|nr:MFS transporter [Methylobacterium frigidaeris]
MGCLFVLVLAQAFNATLTTAAIRKTQFDSVATAARIVSDDWAFRIQNALRFGKPIEQMFGLQEMLASIRIDLPDVSSAFVAKPDGSIVAGTREEQDEAVRDSVRRLLSAAPSNTQAAGTATFRAMTVGDRHLFVTPLLGRRGAIAGGLVLSVPQLVVAKAGWSLARGYLGVLAAITAGGALALLAATVAANRVEALGRSRRYAMAVPLVVILGTQAVSSWYAIDTFRKVYLSTTLANAERSLTRLSLDLQRLAGRGIRPEEIAGFDAPLGRMKVAIAELGAVQVTRPDRSLVAAVPQAVGGGGGPLLIEHDVRSGPEGPVIGRITAELSDAAIAAGVRQRLLDSATIILTSLLFIVELLVLYGVLIHAQSHAQSHAQKGSGSRVQAGARPDSAADGHHLLARPAAFILLFAWALPLSIVPLRMASLASDMTAIPRQILLALPISAEMLAALVTALLAGWLTDRRGWQFPFLIGVVVCALGSALSGLASDPLAYVAARAVVGLGYGLAWMGIQGYVFAWSAARMRTQAVANLVAGIFAGHICGSATGAMLAGQLGQAGVFLVAAVAGLVPIPFAILAMRRYFGVPAANVPAAVAAPVANSAIEAGPGGFGVLARDRSFVALLLLSVVPFSVAQVGLLYYTVPVYLADRGVGQADIGRIMMIYGLSVIYVAPWLGRLVDRFRQKKPFIVAGGLIGGAGLAFCYFDAGVTTLIVSVFLLGLASSLGGPAQSSFALHLPSVQRVGTGRAMGVQRAADKLGQMAGPLLVGALFASVGVSSGLLVTGLYYVGCTLLFGLLASERTPLTSKAHA